MHIRRKAWFEYKRTILIRLHVTLSVHITVTSDTVIYSLDRYTDDLHQRSETFVSQFIKCTGKPCIKATDVFSRKLNLVKHACGNMI